MRITAREYESKQTAERKHIVRRRRLLRGFLLRRHVTNGAFTEWKLCILDIVRELKVNQMNICTSMNKDIGRREVAMDTSGLVKGSKVLGETTQVLEQVSPFRMFQCRPGSILAG